MAIQQTYVAPKQIDCRVCGSTTAPDSACVNCDQEQRELIKEMYIRLDEASLHINQALAIRGRRSPGALRIKNRLVELMREVQDCL